MDEIDFKIVDEITSCVEFAKRKSYNVYLVIYSLLCTICGGKLIHPVYISHCL